MEKIVFFLGGGGGGLMPSGLALPVYPAVKD